MTSATGTAVMDMSADDPGYDFPANPASIDPDIGCPAWQTTMGPVPDEGCMCTPTVVAYVGPDSIPSCGWCSEAYMRGAV